MARPTTTTATSQTVLGLLALRPWTTYELAKQVQRSLGWFWPRAERKLYLCAAKQRALFGGPKVLAMPSRFLKELPDEVLEERIRWGTELYQQGQGSWTPRSERGGSGASVAGVTLDPGDGTGRLKIETAPAGTKQELIRQAKLIMMPRRVLQDCIADGSANWLSSIFAILAGSVSIGVAAWPSGLASR